MIIGKEFELKDPSTVCLEVCEKLDHLRSSRPTAVNLFNAIDDVQVQLKTVRSLITLFYFH